MALREMEAGGSRMTTMTTSLSLDKHRETILRWNKRRKACHSCHNPKHNPLYASGESHRVMDSFAVVESRCLATTGSLLNHNSGSFVGGLDE